MCDAIPTTACLSSPWSGSMQVKRLVCAYSSSRHAQHGDIQLVAGRPSRPFGALAGRDLPAIFMHTECARARVCVCVCVCLCLCLCTRMRVRVRVRCVCLCPRLCVGVRVRVREGAGAGACCPFNYGAHRVLAWQSFPWARSTHTHTQRSQSLPAHLSCC